MIGQLVIGQFVIGQFNKPIKCNHTRDKQIGLPLRGRLICYHSYDSRPNWTPLSAITITYFDLF